MATVTAPNAAGAKKQGGFDFSILVIPIAFVISLIFYKVVCGSPARFDAKGDPKPGDFLALIYKGGFIVPLLFTMLLTVITFTVERLLTLVKAKGTGSVEVFLQNIKTSLAKNDINGALAECAKQKGSVANVVQAGLHTYAEMAKDTSLATEQKVVNITKDIEEATALEMPMLQKNLPVIATIASVGTLVALLGTVLGMIRSFAALASSGTPDPSALSAGISEALVNTAIGIGTSALAIIIYSYLTNYIDGLTYAIDEIGFSIAQSFQGHNK
ncbi:MAG: MotA/TolQ/ExbB proton channel family protein [Chitinophagales bacterium]